MTITKVTEGDNAGKYTIVDAADKYLYAAGGSGSDPDNHLKGSDDGSYWTIEAELSNKDGKSFLVRFYGDEHGKIKLSNEDDTNKLLKAIENGEFSVKGIKKADKQKLPAPPFTTSTLQQEAANKLGFQSARTMRVAQELYEGVNIGTELGGVQGLITYMRTDM